MQERYVVRIGDQIMGEYGTPREAFDKVHDLVEIVQIWKSQDICLIPTGSFHMHLYPYFIDNDWAIFS